ncbi:MAG: leucine-rich repeat domain-containing protein [Treponemataceae bacterium]|nr:leucine-rich repeat domain-containing protein [Treponemataceae bacterium]
MFAPHIITFKDSVTEIRKERFADSECQAVQMPATVNLIGERAFANCTQLTHLLIGEGVTVIEPYAFAGCTALTQVIIPANVIEIGEGAFAGCLNLRYVCIFADLQVLPKYLFKDCQNLCKIVLPQNLIRIEYQALAGCKSLASVNLSESVTEIDTDAFDRSTKIVTKYEKPLVHAHTTIENAPVKSDVDIPACLRTQNQNYHPQPQNNFAGTSGTDNNVQLFANSGTFANYRQAENYASAPEYAPSAKPPVQNNYAPQNMQNQLYAQSSFFVSNANAAAAQNEEDLEVPAYLRKPLPNTSLQKPVGRGMAFSPVNQPVMQTSPNSSGSQPGSDDDLQYEIPACLRQKPEQNYQPQQNRQPHPAFTRQNQPLQNQQGTSFFEAVKNYSGAAVTDVTDQFLGTAATPKNAAPSSAGDTLSDKAQNGITLNF